MNKRHRKSRGGALLICVLVCMLVASAMVTATTRSALQSRRNVRLQHQMRQTELLLDAGVLRAAGQLQLSGDYQGETWRPTGALDRFDHPLVEIRVSGGEEKDDSRRVEVTAILGIPDDPQQINASLTRRTHTFSTELSDISPTAESSTAE